MSSYRADEATIPTDDGRTYLTTVEAAQYLSLHPGTLSNWRGKNEGPAFVKFGQSVRYTLTEIATWAYENSYN